MTDRSDTALPHANKGKLTEGPLGGHLIRLAGPMTWGILMIISFQLVDTFYVAMLGTQALAALTFTFPITFAIFSVIMGFGIAMSSVVSRLIGAGDQDLVRRVATHGLLLVFMIGIILSIIGYITMVPFFQVMGAPEDMIPLITQYMSIWFAGAVAITMPLVGNAAIRATGDAVTPAIIMTIVAVVNVILDPILIFGLLGFPRLELEGAAIATVLANAIAAMAGLYIIYAKKKLICPYSKLRLDLFWDSSKRLLFIALPAGLTNAIQPLVNAVIIALLATSGAEAVAAFGIVSRVEAFAFVILMGVAVGMGPIIGQNYGAQNYERVRETLHIAIRFSVLWSISIAGFLLLTGKFIAGLFSDDPVVIETATLFFMIVPFSYAFSNLLRGWASAFNAMGKPQISFVMIVTELLLLMLPAVWIGYTLGGILGLFFAMAGVNVLAGLLAHLWGTRHCNHFAADQ